MMPSQKYIETQAAPLKNNGINDRTLNYASSTSFDLKIHFALNDALKRSICTVLFQQAKLSIRIIENMHLP